MYICYAKAKQDRVDKQEEGFTCSSHQSEPYSDRYLYLMSFTLEILIRSSMFDLYLLRLPVSVKRIMPSPTDDESISNVCRAEAAGRARKGTIHK